jgi:ribonuclease D
MYDAGSDLALLKNTSDIDIKSILDLRPAVELLNYDRKDLHSVINFELDIKLEKKRKYQQYNWTKRPISVDATEYAINDVIHLLSLKDIILAKLYTKKLFEPFLLKNLQIQNKDYTRGPEDRYRKISGYNGLKEREKTVFRKVFNIRDKYAKQYDMPPHNVIHKGDLLNITKDTKYINNFHFTNRLSMKTIKSILNDIKKAVKAE